MFAAIQTGFVIWLWIVKVACGSSVESSEYTGRVKVVQVIPELRKVVTNHDENASTSSSETNHQQFNLKCTAKLEGSQVTYHSLTVTDEIHHNTLPVWDNPEYQQSSVVFIGRMSDELFFTRRSNGVCAVYSGLDPSSPIVEEKVDPSGRQEGLIEQGKVYDILSLLSRVKETAAINEAGMVIHQSDNHLARIQVEWEKSDHRFDEQTSKLRSLKESLKDASKVYVRQPIAKYASQLALPKKSEHMDNKHLCKDPSDVDVAMELYNSRNADKEPAMRPEILSGWDLRVIPYYTGKVRITHIVTPPKKFRTEFSRVNSSPPGCEFDIEATEESFGTDLKSLTSVRAVNRQTGKVVTLADTGRAGTMNWIGWITRDLILAQHVYGQHYCVYCVHDWTKPLLCGKFDSFKSVRFQCDEVYDARTVLNQMSHHWKISYDHKKPGLTKVNVHDGEFGEQQITLQWLGYARVWTSW